MIDDQREDLAALFTRISRRLIDAERPLLDARGMTMWQYIALTRLSRGSAPTQLELAQSLGYDKTRLIGLLDELERDGLITRERDPTDRRARVVEITAKGRERHAAVAADIRAMEAELLHGLTATQQRTLLTTLAKLAAGR